MLFEKVAILRQLSEERHGIVVNPCRTHLSRFFRQRREARKLSFGDVARRLGYKNVAKGANKSSSSSGTGTSGPTFSASWLRPSKSPPTTFGAAFEEDKAEWERWADEPIEPHLVARSHVRRVQHEMIPAELQASREAMEQFASEFRQGAAMAGVARSHEADSCLVR